MNWLIKRFHFLLKAVFKRQTFSEEERGKAEMLMFEVDPVAWYLNETEENTGINFYISSPP